MLIAGAGADAGWARAAGAELLPGDPVEAADLLTREAAR